MIKLIILSIFSFLTLSPNYAQSNLDNSLCVCANATLNGSLVDEYLVEADSSMFLASLFRKKKVKSGEDPSENQVVEYQMICSGSVVNEEFVLSARHCIPFLFNEYFISYAAAGSNLEVGRIWFKDSQRSELDSHFEPNSDTSIDITLIKVKTPFKLGPVTNIYPACFLDRRIDDYITLYNKYVTIAGYGNYRLIDYYEPEDKNLKLENHQINSTAKFKKSNFYPRGIPRGLATQTLPDEDPICQIIRSEDQVKEMTFCTRTKKDVLCLGGPLLVYHNSKIFLIGVNSKSEKFTHFPDILPFDDESKSCMKGLTSTHIAINYNDYSLSNDFIQWIKQITKNRFCYEKANLPAWPENSNLKRNVLSDECKSQFWLITCWILLLIIVSIFSVFQFALKNRNIEAFKTRFNLINKKRMSDFRANSYKETDKNDSKIVSKTAFKPK